MSDENESEEINEGEKRRRLVALLTPEEKAIYDNLSEETIYEYEIIFKMFDQDGTGEIDSTEIQSVMGSLGHNLTKEQVDDLIKTVDADGNANVDFEEFKILIVKQLRITQDKEEELVEVFKQFDVNNDGQIDT